MGRGIIVLTGTDEINSETVWRLLPAVFRRVNFKVELGYMSKADVCSYLRHFLAPFLPGCTDEEWDTLQDTFTSEKFPLGRRSENFRVYVESMFDARDHRGASRWARQFSTQPPHRTWRLPHSSTLAF